MGSSKIKYKIVLIPGGPGLSSDYLFPLMAVLTKKFTASILKIEKFNKSAFRDSETFLAHVESHLNKENVSYVLIGHSYGCEIALNLFNRKKLNIAGIILINWIPFGHSERFQKKCDLLIGKAKTHQRTEKGFREYFCKILVLYFYNKKNISRYANLVTSRSYYLKARKIAQRLFAHVHSDMSICTSRIYTIVAKEDMLLCSEDIRWMKKVFLERCLVIRNAGHFLILERPKFITKKILQCTKKMLESQSL